LVVITNACLKIENLWHWTTREAARNSAGWYFSSQPGCVASWITAAALDEQRLMLTATAFKRYWENRCISGAESPLLPAELVARSIESGCLWRSGTPPEAQRPELYVGIDIGRTNDRTVIYTLERQKDRAITREVKVLHNTPFAIQKQEIRQRMTRHVVKAFIDRGAVGYQLAEELQAEFGSRCESISLGAAVQGKIAMQVRSLFDRGLVTLPDDPELRADLQLVEMAETINGVPSIKTNRGATGHADRFWAMALAIHAMPINRPQTGSFRPRAVDFVGASTERTATIRNRFGGLLPDGINHG
jgi:phage FluMu gp28-like protein